MADVRIASVDVRMLINRNVTNHKIVLIKTAQLNWMPIAHKTEYNVMYVIVRLCEQNNIISLCGIPQSTKKFLGCVLSYVEPWGNLNTRRGQVYT